MSDTPAAYRFIVACEDDGHFRACRTLMRRCLAPVEWLGDHLSDGCWILEPVTAAVRRFRERFPKRFGSPLHGRGKGPDAMMVRAQLLLWHASDWPFDAAVIVRDLDGHADRRAAAVGEVTEIRTKSKIAKPILLAHPDPEIEAWFVAGFQPGDRAELERLQDERERLGFDPTQRPHELTSRRPTDKRDAKRVLQALTGGAPERIEACLAIDLDELCRRGEKAGLADFVAACRDELAGAFGARP